MTTIQNGVPFEVETDASDYAIAAILSQGGCPVAFMSRTSDGVSRLGLGLERLRSRLGLGLERFRSRSRVLGLETLRMSYLFESCSGF